MNQTSTKNSLNLIDLWHLLKNLTIFVIPMVLLNIGPIQTYILAHFMVNSDVLSIILSSAVKLLEYYMQNNALPVTPTA
jgi:hypothetical protein